MAINSYESGSGYIRAGRNLRVHLCFDQTYAIVF